MIRIVRPYTLESIDTIKKLTGQSDVNFSDIVFLKRQVREVLLARDPNNIQMLRCFSLNNVLKGILEVLLKNRFGYNYDLTSIIID